MENSTAAATHVLRFRTPEGKFDEVCKLTPGQKGSLYGKDAKGNSIFVDVNNKATEGKPTKFLKIKPKGAKESSILTGLFQNEEKGYLSGKDRDEGITYYVMKAKRA